MLGPAAAHEVPGAGLVPPEDMTGAYAAAATLFDGPRVWYWILAFMVVKTIAHNHRARVALLQLVMLAAELCICSRSNKAFLAWLDTWCCLPQDNKCSDQHDEVQEKNPAHHGEACTFLPSFCCPKRRARWEKNWRKKCARRRHGTAPLECCLFSKFFCLPPPLPLQAQVDQHQHGADADESEVVGTTSRSMETEATDIEIDAVSFSSTDEQALSSTNNADVDANNVATQVRTAEPPYRQQVVHFIDQVRMQQWSALLSQPRWRRRQVKYRDTDGLYPLHWAAAGGAPLTVVDRLLDAAASIAQYPDNEGSLPLHFAAHYSAGPDVIAALWRAYPQAVLHRDRYGRTPLYHAVDKSLSLSTLQLLVQSSDSNNAAAKEITACAAAAATTSATVPRYELLTTPCYSPSGATRREQATRTPLFMVWASVLNDRETRLKLRGKRWDKAVWMLQSSYRYHHRDDGKTTAATTVPPLSLVSICIRMDLYLPDPVVPLVAAPQGLLGRLADLVVAAETPSYSLARILELVNELSRRLDNDDDGGGDNAGEAAYAAARAGQPWEVLERLPHRDRHALAIVAALATTPIRYERTITTAVQNSISPFYHDPLGLSRRVQTPKATADTMDRSETNSTILPFSTHDDDDDDLGASPMETIYRLLRENPGQLLTISA